MSKNFVILNEIFKGVNKRSLVQIKNEKKKKRKSTEHVKLLTHLSSILNFKFIMFLFSVLHLKVKRLTNGTDNRYILIYIYVIL